jgi:carboxyl-terminal processing protease
LELGYNVVTPRQKSATKEGILRGQKTKTVPQSSDGAPQKNWKKIVLNVAILVGVFGIGLGIGSNRINLGPDGVYRKSVQQNDGKIDYTGVEELYSKLKNGYDGQLDTAKVEDGLKQGLVKAAGDPYTEYLNEEDAQEFNEGLTGSFEGIGAELGKDGETIVIVAPIAGFPAEKAGLKPKDIITKINDESALDLTTSEAVKKIRGPKGTPVKLEVVRDGKVLNFEIVRDKIDIPSVTSEVVNGNIGVIKITRFGEDTPQLVRQYAQDLKNKNVKGVILDMRGNPGGLLEGAVDISSVWLPKGTRVLEEKRDGKVIKTYNASGNAILSGIPTVVLINEGSASASEIVAGALRDNNAATIIGEKSYGKGSVQELLELNDGGLLKVTIARWFTPSGRNIDKEGIAPDQEVKISDEQAAAKQDPQKDAAITKLSQ